MSEGTGMHKKISRRDALRLGALAAAAPSAAGLFPGPAQAATVPATKPGLAGPAGAPGSIPQSPPIPRSWVVKDFDLDQVTLGQSLFSAHRDLMLKFASSYPADNMLYNFRANAGLPNPAGAEPVGGWDTPDGNLRGHSTGHFMTLLAQAYAGGGGAAYKTELDYIVSALGECQDALNKTVGQPAPPPPAVSWGSGKFGNAVQLSGDGQYVSLPASSAR